MVNICHIKHLIFQLLIFSIILILSGGAFVPSAPLRDRQNRGFPVLFSHTGDGVIMCNEKPHESGALRCAMYNVTAKKGHSRHVGTL